MEPSAVRDRAAELPREPGTYFFLAGGADAEPVATLDAGDDPVLRPDETPGEVLYIGKALDLRDRVGSYVDPRSERIRQMLAQKRLTLHDLGRFFAGNADRCRGKVDKTDKSRGLRAGRMRRKVLELRWHVDHQRHP